MVNAFWLDRDLSLAVRWLVDRHVSSSVFENAMVLTTSAQTVGYRPADGQELYFTHEHHPLTRWAASSHANWQRLHEYTERAHEEWRYRWDHAADEYHKSWATVRSLDEGRVETLEWPTDGATDPPQVTGPWSAADYVDAYRLYYANEKRDLFAWAKDRSPPPWLDDYTTPEGETAGTWDHPY